MTNPDLDFTIRVNQARHDKDFQTLLAQCCGTRYMVREGTMGIIYFMWRGICYVTEELSDLPYSPLRNGPFPFDF